MTVSITVDQVSKQYRLGTNANAYGRLSETIAAGVSYPLRRLRGTARRRVEPDMLWALKDVSLEVEQGDVLGIVGRNGAGKTTLLKILSRITSPTGGEAVLRGRVGALLEVGTGFHPELSGRENIYLNGALIGMRRAEIRRKFDQIVEFSEIERFLDTPVKRYSSGMYVRLAFAVAAHLEPEVLIIDEVLAVGDANFQKKCLGRMNEVAHEGRTVLFVSHNTGAVAELCTRAVLIERGEKLADGPTDEVLTAYSALTSPEYGGGQLEEDLRLPASIVEIDLTDGDGRRTASFDLQDELRLTVRYRVHRRLHGLQITSTLTRNMVNVVHSFDTDNLPEIPVREPGLYEARYTVPSMFLKAGTYTMRVTAGTPEELLQDFDPALTFDVEERGANTIMRGYRRDRPGHVISPGAWETERIE